jgi:uncharacterized protein
LLARRVLEIDFRLSGQIDPVSALLKKYGNVPMSFADACLVRMAELHDRSSIITLDTGFRIHRKHKRRAVPLLMPSGIGC